jgi:NAD(P)-dependent dehydrogenase (short-subunit alcohol dehydrogenase family)
MLTRTFLGGGRGIGLALAYAVAQAGSNVAVLDCLPEPHDDFAQLRDFGAKVEYYKYANDLSSCIF